MVIFVLKMTKIEDIVKYFITNYPHCGKISKIQLLSHNNINSINYIIKTNKGKYVLRKITDNSSFLQAEKMCEVLQFCKSHNALVPEPIKNKRRNFVDNKNIIYITKFYDGRIYKGKKNQVIYLAKSLAKLHKILDDNKIKYNYRKNQIHYQILNLNELNRINSIIIRKKIKDTSDNILLKNFKLLTKSIKEIEEISKFLDNAHFQKQLIHYDLHPGNVLFKNDKVIAILDFNSMRKGYKIEDVVFASFRFACHGMKSIKKIEYIMRLFMNTYLSHGQIEKRQLYYSNYYLKKTIFSRLSYILRSHYFHDSDLWLIDFNKNIQFLKLIDKLKGFRGKYYD